MVKRVDSRSFNLSYRKIVFWSVVFVLAGLVFFMSGDFRHNFVQPGKLSASHSSIEECSACHSAADRNVLEWFTMAVSHDHSDDSGQCLNCHQLGEAAQFAHSIPSVDLKTLTDSKRAKYDLISQGANNRDNKKASTQVEENLQCRACHREHNKNEALVADVSEPCQSCHIQRVDHFDSDHPEFLNFPFRRRTRINFDHQMHIAKYFRESEYETHSPTSCLHCHNADPMGKAMLTSSFETGCSDCHSQQIHGAGRATAMGFEVLAVPALDLETLIDRGAAIGEWPEFADEMLSPFMELLLRSDEHYAKIKPILGTVDFTNLQDASQQQIDAVLTLAWCIKSLVYDLEQEGTAFFQQRLEGSLNMTLSEDQLSALVGLLPEDIIRAVQRDWFPSLKSELPMHREGKQILTVKNDSSLGQIQEEKDDVIQVTEEINTGNLLSESLWGDELLSDELLEEQLLVDDNEDPDAIKKNLNEEQWAMAGGWYRDGYVLRYRPTGHADNFIKSWLTILGHSNVSSALFELLAANDAPGTCTSCHSIDKQNDNHLVVNWQALPRADIPHQFTTFYHLPHLNMLSDTGCQSCHAMDKEADYLASFEGREPAQFSSGFKSIQKEQCAACHNQQTGNDNCLTCHNYHAAEMAPVIRANNLNEFTKEEVDTSE